jgi:transcriptional regulator with XRE-family HTH domain
MKKKISNSAGIPAFQESLDMMSADSKIFVDKSLAIANYIQLVMQHQHLKQKDLAELMGKTEAEVSKWLAGMHNYTLRSLAKIEAALGSDIICVPEKIAFSSPAATENLTMSMSVKLKRPVSEPLVIDYLKFKDLQSEIEDPTKEQASNSIAA